MSKPEISPFMLLRWPKRGTIGQTKAATARLVKREGSQSKAIEWLKERGVVCNQSTFCRWYRGDIRAPLEVINLCKSIAKKTVV